MSTPRERKAASTVKRLTNKLIDEMMYDVAPDRRNEPRALAAGYLAVGRLMVARAVSVYPAAPRLQHLLKAFESDLLSEVQLGPKQTKSGILLPH